MISKVQAILIALLGLLAGILYAFGGFIIDAQVSLGWISSGETSGLGIGTILAFGPLYVCLPYSHLQDLYGLVSGYFV